MRPLPPGRRAVFLPPHALNIDLLQAGTVTIRPVQDTCRERVPKPLTLVIALLVFLQPQRQWTRGEIAAHLSLPVPVLSRRIFAEGSSLRQTVLDHRLSRLFWDLPMLDKIDPDVGFAYGLPDRSRLEDLMFDRYGLSLDQLRRSLSVSSDSGAVRSERTEQRVLRC